MRGGGGQRAQPHRPDHILKILDIYWIGTRLARPDSASAISDSEAFLGLARPWIAPLPSYDTRRDLNHTKMMAVGLSFPSARCMSATSAATKVRVVVPARSVAPARPALAQISKIELSSSPSLPRKVAANAALALDVPAPPRSVIAPLGVIYAAFAASATYTVFFGSLASPGIATGGE